MTNREPRSRWANESSSVRPSRVGVHSSAPEPEHWLCSESREDHAADDLAEPSAALLVSRQQAIGTTPTACICLAVAGGIEMLHVLIRTLLRFLRNEGAGSARRHHRYASRVKPGSAQSAPTVPAAACRTGLLGNAASGAITAELQPADKSRNTPANIRTARDRSRA